MTRNQIIEKLFTGDNFNQCISKMEPAHLQEDLKMEVISIVCEWPENKVIQLHQEGALEFYVVRVILNQVKSKTSPFVKKYRQTNIIPFDSQQRSPQKISDDFRYLSTENLETNPLTKLAAKLSTKLNKQDSISEFREREIVEQLEDLALSEIDSLYWYDAEMIRLYLKLGSFRAIEEYTDIPFISCYKNIKKSLATLKRKAIEKAQPLFSKEELSFIQNNKNL